MDKFETLEKCMCKELESIEKKLQSSEMATGDLEKIDKLTHAMKSLATYRAMKEAEETSMDGMSGRRGRAANGQYISRDDASQSYADGYSHGYSEAMNQQSGHYPPMPPHVMDRYRY